MKQPVRYVLRILLRLLTLWMVDAVAVYLTVTFVPGVNITSVERGATAFAVALLLAVVNIFLRPIILLLALPLGFFVIFAVGFFINSVTLLIVARIVPTFTIDNVLAAFLGGLGFSFINTLITAVLDVDNDDSFYEGLVERLAARQRFAHGADQGRGLVMMEIDGLSYHHLQRALADGYMPHLQQMLNEEGYKLSHVDCGLPSQTSACQAGIMFGDNFDIPSFRWYDKDEQKLFVSGKDAWLLNGRYSTGAGLMSGGSSINNMLAGDAEKSVLTMANLLQATPAEKKRRAEDIYLLMLNPYFIMRTMVLFLGDMLREVVEYQRDKAQNVQPRLNRLHHFYPAVRAATTVLMRDISAYLTVLDIVRGSPAIYVTWPGYDEVAHHSGPWSKAAFHTLRQYDRVIGRVKDIIERKAPRPYDLIILSDHGQSFGHTFLQRYGYTLKDFIQRQLPTGTSVEATAGGDDGTLSLTSMSAELKNVQEQRVGGAAGRAVMRRADRLAERANAAQLAGLDLAKFASVTVCGSGNLAQVYFDLFPRKVTQPELEAVYPGLIDALVQHEGVGLLVLYDAAGQPLALGKGGQRNLHSGEVRGDDPLKMYGNPELRATQVRRVADFPHAGDLMVISTVYPDGTVAAMEELIGNHGGMGGEQTDAFIFHPSDMPVPPTANSADVYPILRARREATTVAPKPPKKQVGANVDAWSPPTMWLGLRQVKLWLGLLLRVLVFDRAAFREMAQNGYLLGPALFIGLVGTVANVVATQRGNLDWALILGYLLLWPVSVYLIYVAARLLGGQGTYTSTFTVIGFAYSGYWLGWLFFIPGAGPLVSVVGVFIEFLGAWQGVAQAHHLRGWRALLIPIIQVIVIIALVGMLRSLLLGVALSIESIFGTVG